MNRAPTESLLGFLTRQLGSSGGDCTDRALLQQFIREQDQSAFQSLVDRHGPLVRGLCLRILGNSHEADDVFQATFLVLARRASSIRQPESVGPWLYGVAQRIARRLRVQETVRREHEKKAAELKPTRSTEDMTLGELRRILDEELERLPEKYRAPLILCCLEGKARDEAAQELGWSAGSVKGRLERGRELLRARLAQRGIALSAGLLALTLGGAQAAVPPALQASTAAACLAYLTGKPLAGLASAQALNLAREVLQGSMLTQLKLAALSLVLLLGGSGTILGLIGGGAVETAGPHDIPTLAATAPSPPLPAPPPSEGPAPRALPEIPPALPRQATPAPAPASATADVGPRSENGQPGVEKPPRRRTGIAIRASSSYLDSPGTVTPPRRSSLRFVPPTREGDKPRPAPE